MRIDGKLKYLAPVFLLLLVVYLYSSLVSPVLSKRSLQYVEIVVVTYFVSELVIKYIITDDYKRFFRDYWFDIVLLVPFFKSLKLLGAAGKALKSLKGLKYAKYVQKAAKLPKMVRNTLLSADGSGKKRNDEKG